jgi:hypothetical protein
MYEFRWCFRYCNNLPGSSKSSAFRPSGGRKAAWAALRTDRKRDDPFASGYLKLVGQRYPLAALSTLRTATAEQRARALAAAEGARQSALSALEQAQRALEAARDELRRSESSAAERLGAGLERVFDLGLAADERRAQELCVRALELEAQRAARELERSEQLRDEASGLLARAEAERRALEQHRVEWLRRAALAREEQRDEEALERWTSEQLRSGKR